MNLKTTFFTLPFLLKLQLTDISHVYHAQDMLPNS